MRTQLYAHNKTAFQKVMKAFEQSDRTCVVHPTGTGKSYLIAAVSESYQKVLILGPNDFVLNQVHDVLRWRKDGVEYMTYQMLNRADEVPTGYDLICLDEFHRAGAPSWGVAVDEMLERNPQAKVFGTSATPIRYRIRITNVKIERMQDISDEDCRKEGIVFVQWRQYPEPFSDRYVDHDLWTVAKFRESVNDSWGDQDPDEFLAESPKVAFYVLIRKLMGKKTWDRNPWVWVYEFELIK